MRKLVTTRALGTLRKIGAFSLAADSPRRRDSLLILCYHGISLGDEHKWWPHMYLTPAQFRSRLECIRRTGASVLALDEALDRLQRGYLPLRSVVITFDDGFVDFAKHAVPILSEFGYPCTLYLTTHYCDRRLPIIGLALDYVLWKSRKGAAALPKLGIRQSLPLHTFEQRQLIVRHILAEMDDRGMTTLAKDELAREIAADLGVDYDEILRQRILQIMSPSEVREAVKAGIDIQLHTHRHRTPGNKDLFLQEIEDNRRRIIELTGKEPVHFCYPSGQYEPQFFGWLAECGVKSATTCETGLAKRSSPAMKLPRVLDDSGMNLLRFESVLSGLFV
jgi:peptidoglycan/xylan/chitin deacetylase (PgdA/CDA1 family)